jgi:hypothetical protein
MFVTGITMESITFLWKGLATLNQFADKLTDEIRHIQITTLLGKHSSISCELLIVFHLLSVHYCFFQCNEIKKVNSRQTIQFSFNISQYATFIITRCYIIWNNGKTQEHNMCPYNIVVFQKKDYFHHT